MAGKDPMRCEHDRTPATCEDCAHAAALADPRRAGATRDELHPFPAEDKARRVVRRKAS